MNFKPYIYNSRDMLQPVAKVLETLYRTLA